MMRRIQWVAATVAVAFVAAIGAVYTGATPPAQAIGCTVMNVNDTGAGSLRETLADTNCDAITFAPGVTGTIAVATNLPAVARPLTITGPGFEKLTISANTTAGGRNGLTFHAGADVSISGLTIFAHSECVYADGGKVSLERTRLIGCHDGMNTQGATVTMNEVWSGQHQGAAIEGGGNVTVTNSTLSRSHDGVYFYLGGTLTVVNTSIINIDSSGIWASQSTLTVKSTTVTTEFDGIHVFNSPGGVSIANTIISQIPGGFTGSNCGGNSQEPSANGGNNLSDDPSCFADGANGSHVVSNAALGFDPAGEQFNGGFGQSLALTPGSVAVDAGNDAICTAIGAGAVNGRDQRGVSRTSGAGAHCDIGAYERSSTCFVTNAADTPTGGTLREKVADVTCARIEFEPGLMNSNDIVVGSALPTINRSLEIDGPGKELLTISGDQGGLLFVANGPGTFSVSGVTVSGFNIQFWVTGATFNLSDADLVPGFNSVTFNGPALNVTRASFSGGGAHVTTAASSGPGTIVDSTFYNAYGQSLNLYSGLISGSTFSGSSPVAAWVGGPVTIVNSTFVGVGDAVTSSPAGDVTLRNATFYTNELALSGPGAVTGVNVLMQDNGLNCEFAGNMTFSSSIADDPTCFTGGSNGNIEAEALLALNALQENGGPTKTVALQAESPARGAGNFATCSAVGVGQVSGVDQRGVGRTEDGTCDMGAYEFARKPQSIPPFTIPNTPLATQSMGIQGLSDAGLPLTYSGVGSCSVSGGIITFLSAGPCAVTANQPGNEDYLPATPVVVVFQVYGPGPVTTITLAPATPNGLNGWYRTPVGITVSAMHPTQTPEIHCGTALGTTVLSYGVLPNSCFSGTNIGQFFDTGIFTITAASTTVEGVVGDVVYKTVKIDRALPTQSVTGPTNGATYLQGTVPAASCSSADEGSGLATPSVLSVTGGNAWGGGTFTATCSGVTDVAGNVGLPASISYNVTCTPSRTYQGVISVKVNAALSLPRVVTVVASQDVATCAFKGLTVATNPANQQGAIQVATANANWKPVTQTGADQWAIGVKTANATTGGVYLNSAFRALNGSTTLAVKFVNGRTGLYLKLAGMAPTGVGTTLAGIEAETGVPLVQVTPP